jgi:hypothetical protein
MTDTPQERRLAGFDDRRAESTNDRRNGDGQALLELVKRVHADVSLLNTNLNDQKRDEALALAEAVSKLMITAFPDGDPSGHKAIHEADIQAAKDRAEFWKKMRFELSRAGLLAFLGWACVQLWHGVLVGPKS